MAMRVDRLFILDREYQDPAFSGEAFYCKDCILIEGLLAAFPNRTANLEIVRVPWPRPRPAVVAAIGADNQNLPAIVFADGGFENEINRVLEALHLRHGFPRCHP
jgi:hypothetical protein